MTVMSTTMPADAGPAPMGNPSAARLVVPKMTAAQHIRAHIQHGISIRRQRIRYIEDLEDVRALKTEWVNSYTGTLQQLFSGSDIATRRSSVPRFSTLAAIPSSAAVFV